MTSDAYRHARPAELTGSVSWLQRLLPPPGAGPTVELIEAGPGPGRCWPSSGWHDSAHRRGRFRLEFDPARIDPAQRYVLRARVDFDGRTRFANRLDYPVLTHDAPAHVDVIVDAAAADRNHLY